MGRILTLRNTGYYSDPQNIHDAAWTYHHKIRADKLAAGQYADVAHVDGYVAGHLFLFMPHGSGRNVPFYYMFDREKPIYTHVEFKKLLARAARLHPKSHRFARALVKRAKLGGGITFHHRPALF